MSSIATLNGVQYIIPAYNDTGWAQGAGNLSLYLAAVAANTLQPSGGAFTLTADVDFGANFGIKALFVKSETANPAATGVLRLAKTDQIRWRNNANSADVALSMDGSDYLNYSGSVNLTQRLANTHIFVGGSAGDWADVAMSGHIAIANTGATTIQAGVVTNAMIVASAGIPYSKLTLTGAVLNADLAGSIAYSKLVLTGAILNADLAGSIAYSKLTLTGAILNADLAGSIAYSKLTLTGAILNADINASAAIAVSKLAAMTVSRDIRSDSSGFLAVKPLAVQATTTTAASVTSNVFTTTNLTASITPSSTAARIKITVTGDLKAANVALANANLTIARGSTNLASTNGFALTGRVTTATGTFTNSVAVVYVDSPASSTSVTYNVQIRSDDNTTAAVFPAFTTGVITLEEIS